MPDKCHALRSALITLLLPAAFGATTDSGKSASTEQTIGAIQNCMAQTPAPWPNEWKREYIETIRKGIEPYRYVSHYVERLKILRDGFQPYWESFKKNNVRSSFEVHHARIRWYVEHLMGTEFPSEDKRQSLRDQYTELWNYATESLLEQFPFLDPNAVKKAKQEDLSVCCRKIEAPLMPVYLRPMSEEQVEQIKQHWNELRYARVDLLRRLSGDLTLSQNGNALSPDAERDYKVTKESFSELLGLVWKVVPQRPDYYLTALENQNEAMKHRIQERRQIRIDQQRLEKMRSRQLLQIEHISFLLTTLLETSKRFDKSASTKERDLPPLEQRENLRREVIVMRT